MSYSVPRMAGDEDPEFGGDGPGQWPRWEVFVRPRGGVTHVHSESAHAPDAETALQNARDTYLRRVEGVGLWVVPAEAIVRRDDVGGALPAVAAPTGERVLWEAFLRHRRGAAYLHAGSVAAVDAADAVARAGAAFLAGAEGAGIWVAPSSSIVAADPDDAPTLFEPFADKDYRKATFYDIPDEVGHM